MKEEKLTRWIAVVLTVLTMLVIPSACYLYSQDKKITLLEMHDVMHAQEITDLKAENENKFNKIDSKLDNITSNISNMSISVAKISTYFEIKLGKNGQEIKSIT